MGRRILLDLSPIGHNSLSADFVYPRGVQAPHVIGRERGVIPGSFPGDIHTYHTHAEPNEWLNYLYPNACHYPPKQAELATRMPIEEVHERASQMADQYINAVQAYLDGTMEAEETLRIMGAKEVLSHPKTARRLFMVN